MKNTFLLLALFLCTLIFGQKVSADDPYTGLIVTEYKKVEHVPLETLQYFIGYNSGSDEFFFKKDGYTSTYAAKFSRSYSEQGLIIKEYLPTGYYGDAPKKIFKVGFEEKTMEPIVVVEIFYNGSTYSITKYFTKKWAELTNYK